MKIQNYTTVKGVDAAPGAVMRILAGPDEGAPSFVMRLFEIEPGGGTPHHSHAWEHELFVVEGNGVLKSGNTERPITEGQRAIRTFRIKDSVHRPEVEIRIRDTGLYGEGQAFRLSRPRFFIIPPFSLYI